VSALSQALQAVVRELDSLEVSHALVGGLAVSVRAEPRFTRDIDLAVEVEGDQQAKRVVRSFVHAGWEVVAQVKHAASGRLSTIRPRSPGPTASQRVIADLLFASSGFEPEIVAAAEVLDVFKGVEIPVARQHRTCSR